MGEPVAGKFLLEILTKGMYSNPMHVYREYIQNASDSIDKAVKAGVLEHYNAEIHIYIEPKDNQVIIKDNGLGISCKIAETKLLSVGDSDKDGIVERGFRGIGRLGGLAYADKVQFITSAPGESTKTIMTCDCIRMRQLLQKSNKETSSIMETFTAISEFDFFNEQTNAHYFEVRMFGVPTESGLLEENSVIRYLAETAPVDFDGQAFSQARKIKEFFEGKGYPIPCYKIYRGSRKIPVYKLYSRSMSTGLQARTKETDYVRDVEFIYQNASDGKPLYIGWLAITDFSGSIADEVLQGIRFRKGNILIGNNATFAKFFLTTEREGQNANKMFAGEIHILHEALLPNSQRDDFEPNEIYNELRSILGEWARTINKNYRRGTSEANSALKKLAEINEEQNQLEVQVNSGAITSDAKREKIAEDLERIAHRRQTEENKVRKALEQGIFDSERKSTIEKTLSQTETATKKISVLSTKIINADYATKKDLPTSYSRDERNLYQRIIAVIDDFFASDPETAVKLRKTIKSELSVKKK
ncbi:chaperone protein HtpG [Ruminiclostridium hungatei]|uniref:Chaperone protein HtpG n=1 Tax=Ruminiclostridium hungatei TaxID=48256 RepID=A0A1V4SR42_RUMHU|nr:ATP-binding protein [Ruminiclostridium hungatei]OPX45751.1 chaperone protein HtpG [Ruminiclostridium hungatei]